MRAIALAVLATALVLGFVLRTAMAPGHVLDTPLADGTDFLVDDPDAAYHLRRVELSLANGRVPDFDRFLSHPQGSPVPWPAAFSGALTLTVQRALEPDREGRSEIGGFTEAQIERLLAALPPWIGLGAVLATALAACAFMRGAKGRFVAAALAALVLATTPIAIWYGASGRIDHHVAIQLLFALQLGAVAVAVRSTEPVDGLTFALVAGVLTGTALVVWLPSALFAGLGGVAFFVAALAATGPLAAARRRAGILFLAATAAVVIVPADSSPWNATQPGSLVNLTMGVPLALLAACGPFVALEVAARLGWGRGRAVGAALAALAAAVALLPGFAAGVAEGFAWASRGNLFMDVVAESRPLLGRGAPDAMLALSDLGPVGVLFPAVWLVLVVREILARRFAPERLLLLASALLWSVQTLGQRRFGDTFAVPLAIATAVLVHDLLGSGRRGAVRAGWVAAALVVLAALPGAYAVLSVPPAEHAALLAWRTDVVGGLRWMRTGTPSPGPWNAPDARQDWGVLAHWGMGHMIEYHARRPTVATNFGSFVGQRGFVGAAAALVESDGEQFAERARELGADCVVVRARDVSDLASLARIAEWAPKRRAELFERTPRGKAYSGLAQRTALWRLGVHDLPVGATAPELAGFELIHRSAALETVAGAPPSPGQPVGPRLSVWRRIPAERSAPDAAPSMGPPR